MHLQELRRYGVDERGLRDGCVAAYVGAWHYRRQVERLGNTWAAVGAYHSRTPARQAWYANQIATILMQWQVLPSGALPYVGVSQLAPSQPNPQPRDSRVAAAAAAGTTIFDSTQDERTNQ